MSSIIPSIILDAIIEVFPNSAILNINFYRIVLGFLMTALFVYVMGIGISILGKKFFSKIEKNIFYNIPVFSTIYKTIKQIVESVSNPDINSF